ncbi:MULTISPECIES: alpha/beta hydrolase family esterase [Sorangium]|uniref:Esterase/lipase/thioesterase family protein n=1 Tax=Sorangium cellulosum (strain So ce56) TaxID=448385 RepID=A9GMG6_SORC5|nr:esterase/lipase/thioesterase [Sorangium cellulosum]CAN93435.1 Esterase/lipase/thioesterase family protein [Sorangium cellulosum So ce56]
MHYEKKAVSRFHVFCLLSSVAMLACGDESGDAAQAAGAGSSSVSAASAASTGVTAGSSSASGGTSSGEAASSGGATAGAGGAGSGGAGSGGAGGAGGAGTGGSGGGGGGGDAVKSAGCGKMRTLQNGAGTVQSGGKSRKYALRVPDDYDNGHPYRLILSFHGATGNSGQVAPSYFGLWSLSEGSTIFIAPDAVDGFWSADDVTFVDDILEQVTGDLCIDTSRIELEGFSQGGAMAWTLACARPEVYRAAVVHSGGGLPRPASCPPVAFMSSLGQQESGGAGQTSNSDFFAKQNGCTVEALPKAPRGGHACSDYKGCSAGHPTRWCDYDGGHTPSPNDAGKQMSWMPEEVWAFLNQF